MNGNNPTTIAFLNSEYEIVKELIKEGYFCKAKVYRILSLYYEPLKSDNVKRFEHLIYFGFKDLDKYLTFDGKNLVHLVSELFSINIYT